MLLDTSFYGIGRAALKAAKVALWVTGSTAAATLVNEIARQLSEYGTAHPEYIAYSGAAILAANTLGVFLKEWFTSLDPRKVSAPAQTTQALPALDAVQPATII